MKLIVANLITLVVANNTAGSIDMVVPSNHMYRLRQAHLMNGDDVARVGSVQRKSGAGTLIGYFAQESLGQWVYMSCPSGDTEAQAVDRYSPSMECYQGEKLCFVFAAGGASTGGNCYVSYVIEDYSVEELPYEIETIGG